METTVYCLAPGCKNNSKTTQLRDPPVVYHKIKDDRKWYHFCSFIRRSYLYQKLADRPDSAICSEHFKPEDYENQGDHVLFEDAVPSVPAPFEETKEMCYMCFSPSSEINLVPFDIDVQTDLDIMGIGFLQIPTVPQKLCEVCHNEVNRIFRYLQRIKSANDFWYKFGLNMGLVLQKTKRADGEGLEIPSKSLGCITCGENFITKDALFKHTWKYHVVDVTKPTICGTCNKTYATEMTNRQHYFQTHYEGPCDEQIICSDCGYLAKSSKNLTLHMKYTHDVHNEDRIRCEWCIMSFFTQERLDRHIEERHPETLAPENHKMETAPVAKYEVRFKDEGNVGMYDEESSHMDMDDGPYNNDDYNDDDDDEDDKPLKVKQEKDVKHEKDTKHEEPHTSLVEEYKPEKKKSKSKSSRPSKQDDVTQKCPDCDIEITGKFVMARGGIYRHYWVRHGRLPETPNTCRECNKSYHSETRCRKHFFDHHFDVTFCCDLCGKTGMTKFQLKIHVKNAHKNDGKEIMICRFCNRKYDNMEDMQAHEETHKDDGYERPFVCNECGKCYTKQLALARHMQQHMGIRPYKCKYCEMTFMSSANRNTHELQHTGLNPFRCSLCDKEFKQLGLIHRHILKYHGTFDRHVVHSEIIIRQHGRTSNILGEKQPKRTRAPRAKQEKVQVVYNSDYYEASNSVSSL